MASEATIAVPEPPPVAGLPENVKKQWKETYLAAYKQAQIDQSTESNMWPQTATREANRILRVPELTGYEQAKALPAWQIVHRDERDGRLRVVTSDGRKYLFDVPKAPADAPKAPAKKT